MVADSFAGWVEAQFEHETLRGIAAHGATREFAWLTCYSQFEEEVWDVLAVRAGARGLGVLDLVDKRKITTSRELKTRLVQLAVETVAAAVTGETLYEGFLGGVIRWGKHKGKHITDPSVPLHDLAWMANSLTLDDKVTPDAVKRAEAQAEIDRRAGGSSLREGEK